MTLSNQSGLNRCIVVMGVSGSGKSSVAEQLAELCDAVFIDGDDLHPAHNIEKMAKGEPLTDEDRAPWLHEICAQSNKYLASGEDVVVVCSALKYSYRHVFRQHIANLTFVFLQGDYTLIEKRMTARQGHFMKAGMLKSQFETLEPPGEMENDVISIDISAPLPEVVQQAYQLLPLVSE